MDGSWHTVTRYLSNKKRNAAINNKKFKLLGYTEDQPYEVELVKTEVEHKEPIFFGFLIMQYANWEK